MMVKDWKDHVENDPIGVKELSKIKMNCKNTRT